MGKPKRIYVDKEKTIYKVPVQPCEVSYCDKDAERFLCGKFLCQEHYDLLTGATDI